MEVGKNISSDDILSKGKEDQQALLFTEIQKRVLIEATLYFKSKELDQKIIEIAVFRYGKANNKQAHAFVVLKTDQFVYSFERMPKGIPMQVSQKRTDVTKSKLLIRKNGLIQETNWSEGEEILGALIDYIKSKIITKKD